MAESNTAVSDVDRGFPIIVLASVFTTLSSLTTAIRLTVRGINRQLGWDDLAIAAATTTAIVQWPFNILSVKSGFGRHVKYIHESQAQRVIEWVWFAELFLFLTLPLAKCAICLFIFRIQRRGWLKWCLYGLMAGLVITNLICIILLLAQCQPTYAYWDRTAGTCWSIDIYNGAIWAQVGYSIFSDLACTSLPVIVLWNIKIPTRWKLALPGLMSVGLIATACAIVRAALSAANNKSKDTTWSLAIVTDWAILEEHFAILGANLALARYVFLYLRDGKRDKKYQISSRTRDTYRKDWMNTKHAPSTKEGLSSDSLAPVGPGAIRKTTDLCVSSGPRSNAQEYQHETIDLGLDSHTNVELEILQV